MICKKCAERLPEDATYCRICGTRVETGIAVQSLPSSGAAVTPGRRKFFYGAWIFINVIFVLQLFSATSAPVDRFRNLCITEGLDCAPSAQDQAANAIGNLIIWNLIFWGFRYWHRKRRRGPRT